MLFAEIKEEPPDAFPASRDDKRQLKMEGQGTDMPSG